jgi:hypothetical protein
MRGDLKMKKLLVVMMVLGLTVSAQAGISLSLDGADAPAEITITVSTNVMIDVTSDDALAWGGFVKMGDDAPAEWVGQMVILPAAGKSATASLVGAQGYMDTWMLSAAALPGEVPQVSAGKQFEIGFHCLAPGDVVITLLGDDLATVKDMLVIHQVIPEPVTIGLLGLGGLFLRRRK